MNMLEGGVRETVESIIDRYIRDWGFTAEETLYQVGHEWEMDVADLQRAVDYLMKKYLAK